MMLTHISDSSAALRCRQPVYRGRFDLPLLRRDSMHPLHALLLLYLLWLAVLHVPQAVLADYSLQLYSDTGCTVPLPGFPAVSNNAVGVLQNQTVCGPASQFSPLWLPSPTASPVQWLAYEWDLTYTDLASLSLAVYTFSNASSQCPLNTTDPHLGASAALFFGYTRPSQLCRLAMYIAFNTTSNAYDVTTLSGTWSCTVTASMPNHGHPRAMSAALVLMLPLALLLSAINTLTN